MQSLFESLEFKHGPAMPNRFMLAPLTNSQSHEDGLLSHEEFVWLTMRAQGGFGLTMTCASHVQELGKGFPGQLGCFSDDHLDGLTRLAKAIREHNSVSSLQLYHGGMRCPEEVTGVQPVCPSADEETHSRAMTEAEVHQVIADFISAAERAERAGFEGVELHGAHGYLICQFLSAEINRRDDEFGGSLENRSRMLQQIISGIRSRCGADFQLGLRLSPERFGMQLGEIIELTQELMREDQLDYLDMSLWDVFKEPEEAEFKGRSLMSYFTELDRGTTRLGVAGKIFQPDEAIQCLDAGCDFVIQGRAGILHHDYPNRLKQDPGFSPAMLPVTRDYLRSEGLSDRFLDYMSRWPGFIEG